MDHAGAMGGLERFEELDGDPDRARHGERALARKQGRQLLALQQLHDHEQLPALELPEVEDLDDAGVARGACGARLVEEAARDVREPGVLAPQDLQRQPSADLLVDRLVHVGHRAAADPAHDAVLLCQQAADRVTASPLPVLCRLSLVVPHRTRRRIPRMPKAG